MKTNLNNYKDHLWLLFFMVISVGFVVAMVHILPEPTPPTEGIPHNYWMPNKNRPKILLERKKFKPTRLTWF